MKKHCFSTRILALTCALGISISVAADANAAETVPDTNQPLAICQRDLGSGINVQFVPEYKKNKLVAAVLIFRYYGPKAPKINPGKIELYSLPDGRLIAPSKSEKKISDAVKKAVDEKYFDSVRFSLSSLSSSTENLASVFLEGAATSGQDDIGKTINIRFSDNSENSQKTGNVGIQGCRPGLEGWKPKEPLQQRLQSKDIAIGQPAAVELLKSADTAYPMNLMIAAYQLSLAGSMNDAAFWLYAGNLRADYFSIVEGREFSGLARGLYLSMGRPAIDAKAMLDVPKMVVMLEKVLQWDDKTFETWCIENEVNSKDEKLQSRRKVARQQVMDFTKELLANRDKYEKQARDYKSPEQKSIEKNAEIARDIGRLKEITGLGVTSFQGQYEGSEFSIPREESKAPTSNLPKLAASKVVGPQVALETAILDGIIRHATVDDVNEFYGAYVYKKYTKNKLSVPAHETALEVIKVNIARAYVVLREFIYPEGMVDDQRVVFFVPQDVPGPTGDIGHSATYEFATLMVTCTAARTGGASC